MEISKSKLVIEENTLYEIDLECLRKKERAQARKEFKISEVRKKPSFPILK